MSSLSFFWACWSSLALSINHQCITIKRTLNIHHGRQLTSGSDNTYERPPVCASTELGFTRNICSQHLENGWNKSCHTWYLPKAKTRVSRIKLRYGTSSVQASSSRVANAEQAASWTLLLGSKIRFSNYKCTARFTHCRVNQWQQRSCSSSCLYWLGENFHYKL